MRAALLLTALVALGFLSPTDALCDLKNGDTAVCHRLNDVKNIDIDNLANLQASVQEKTLTSTSLKALSALKTLDLSGGDLEFIEPGTFHEMSNLVHLKLDDNSIAVLKDSALDGLTKLKSLELRRNNIEQLPSALTKLEKLRNLEVSGNPLVCNCATLRVRDELLENAVKISKKVYCSKPSHLKGVSLLKPEAEVICMFEEQDAEMQGDEPVGSGDGDLPDDVADLDDLPREEDVPIPATPIPDETDDVPKIVTDDLIIPVLSRGLENSVGSQAQNVYSESSTASSDSEPITDDFEFDGEDLILAGSGFGDPENEGSGTEGSGTGEDLIIPEEEQQSSTAEPTTSTKSWLDVFFSTFSRESDNTTPSDDADPDDSVTEEHFIKVLDGQTTSSESPTTEESEEPTTPVSIGLNRGVVLPDLVGITEPEVVTKKADVQGAAVNPSVNSSSSEKPDSNVEDFSPPSDNEDTSIDDRSSESTGQTKKSMGSYVVLAALLGVLAALIGFAAYKGNFCKKKPSNDPEQGTELKDMQKGLLEGNGANQVKISSNGNPENVPLVGTNPSTWSEPRDIRPWQEPNSPTVDNGTKQVQSVPEPEPVKPPRKSLPPQDDSNGVQEVKTHSPLSSFAARTNGVESNLPNSVTPPNSPSSVMENGNRSPPLSPNTQRVKITLQENPDSIPKTPILITRTKPGINLVKTP